MTSKRFVQLTVFDDMGRIQTTRSILQSDMVVETLPAAQCRAKLRRALRALPRECHHRRRTQQQVRQRATLSAAFDNVYKVSQLRGVQANERVLSPLLPLMRRLSRY